MGCAYGREHESDEELEVQKGEAEIALAKKQVKSVVEAFESVGNSAYLSIPEYTRLMRYLDLSKLTVLQHELFQQFQKPEGYERRTLYVCALLMCQGHAEPKSAALFMLYSEEGRLSRGQMQTMVEEMLTIAISRTTILTTPTDSLKSYLQRLNDRSPRAVSSILQLLTNNRKFTSKSEFIAAFTSNEGRKLLNCKGIRKFIYSKSQEKT